MNESLVFARRRIDKNVPINTVKVNRILTFFTHRLLHFFLLRDGIRTEVLAESNLSLYGMHGAVWGYRRVGVWSLKPIECHSLGTSARRDSRCRSSGPISHVPCCQTSIRYAVGIRNWQSLATY